MHLLSCEHPKRVYNKYTNEHIWVPCGKCNSCKNRRAKKYTDACERERKASAYTFFVTLTYDEPSLPVYNFTGGFDSVTDVPENLQGVYLLPTHDDEQLINFDELYFEEDSDKELFLYYLTKNGIPYASRKDMQLFHKRLNKYFHDNVSNKYQNFRYFVVSEYGSTTLRPHFHGIYFVNDSEVARHFQDGILSCWKFGRTDTQYVQKSACSYVAQYTTKFADLPSFYQKGTLRPFILASRNPFIGTVNQYSQSDEEIFDKCIVQTFTYGKKDTQPVLVTLDQSTENRLFPKCPFFGKISHSLRAQLYTIVCRIKGANFKEFLDDAFKWINCLDKQCCVFAPKLNEFTLILQKYVDNFSVTGINWLRRLYYLSRKVYRQASRFAVSISDYIRKIEDYYNKKALFLLSQFYKFQSDYVEEKGNCSDDLSLMYPEYLHSCGLTIGDVLENFTPTDVVNQRKDAEQIQRSNKRTHFKNMYLEALSLKNNHYYSQLKKFYYAKKCNETLEALPT